MDFDKIPSIITDSNLHDSDLLPINIKKPQKPKKPSIVPTLDIFKVLTAHHSDSDTSSDLDGNSQQDEGGGKGRHGGPNPRQFKKIIDKYNIVTCARNINTKER